MPQQLSHPEHTDTHQDRPGPGATQPFRSPTCIANLDSSLIIRQANDDFVTQFRYPAEAMYGRSFYELVHPSMHRPLEQEFSRLIDGRRNRFVSQLIAVLPHNGALSGELTGTVVSDRKASVAGIMVLVRPTSGPAGPSTTPAGRKVFSEIDARILEGIAAGSSTIQLAMQMYLSRQGVEYHVSAMLRKLKVPNRAALVSKAYSMGVLHMGVWPPAVVGEFVRK